MRALPNLADLHPTTIRVRTPADSMGEFIFMVNAQTGKGQDKNLHACAVNGQT